MAGSFPNGAVHHRDGISRANKILWDGSGERIYYQRHVGQSIRPQNHKPDKTIPREDRYLRGQQKAALRLYHRSLIPRDEGQRFQSVYCYARAPRGKREKESSHLDFPAVIYLISMVADFVFQWPAPLGYHAPQACTETSAAIS